MSIYNKNKISVLSYLTFIGWLWAFSKYQKGSKSSLVKFHLEQSLGLAILVVVTNALMILLVALDPLFKIMMITNNMGLVILWVAGLLSAINGVRLPLPVIGFYFKDKFGFIQ